MSTIKADAITASTGTNTNIAITGKGSGKLKLGDGELLFPDADGSAGQYIKTDGSANLAFATLPAASTSGAVILSTQAAASGTAVAFTSIPAGTNWILLTFWLCSMSGTDDFLVQLGDSGGLETSGYVGHGHSISNTTLAVSNSTAGMPIRSAQSGAAWQGHMTLTRAEGSAHKWVSTYNLIYGNLDTTWGGSYKTLTAELDRITVGTTGSDTFDQAGATISLAYM